MLLPATGGSSSPLVTVGCGELLGPQRPTGTCPCWRGETALEFSQPCEAVTLKPFPSAHGRLQTVLGVIPGFIRLLSQCSWVCGRSDWGAGARFEVFYFPSKVGMNE